MPVDERNSRGQFQKGWRGGPGNPHASEVSRLRAELLRRIRQRGIGKVLSALFTAAEGGDIAAARVVLSYAVGDPAALHGSADAEALERVLRDQLAEHEPTRPGVQAPG